MPKTELLQKDPADLKLHSLQRKIPAPVKDSPEWNAFVDGMQAAGPDGIPPLFITEDGQIMDGGWRWRGAKQLQWDRLPCIVRPEAQAAVIIVETLLHRKQMTRGACVYLALGVMKEFVESAEYRRLENLRQGRKTREIALVSPNPSNSDSVKGLCERWGIGWDTLDRARKVHQVFSEHPEIKTEWEPKLLSGEKNLWNVISGTAGAAPQHQTGRDNGVAQSQLELFEGALDNLKSTGKTWKKLDPQRQELLIDKWRDTVKSWPAELRAAVAEVLKEAA
jgi:hypothetical protein